MPPRIMVINDTQEVMQLLREILLEEGYEVVLHSFSNDDLAEIEQVAPDLIIIDYMFGEEKFGWQTVQKLKLRRSTAQIPVIICTVATTAVREIEGHLLSQGIGLVHKPFNIDALTSEVRCMLGARQLDWPQRRGGRHGT